MYDQLKADYEEQKQVISSIETDFVKFCNGNDSAGTRVRKSQQRLKELAQSIREAIQDIKNEEA